MQSTDNEIFAADRLSGCLLAYGKRETFENFYFDQRVSDLTKRFRFDSSLHDKQFMCVFCGCFVGITTLAAGTADILLLSFEIVHAHR